MKALPIRSPAEKVGGIVYFGRMLDKIRAHAKGQLPAEYQENLGKGFDARCAAFLRVDYKFVVDLAIQGKSDGEILQRCFENSRRPSEDEIHVWNEFMRKRGWNDDITETLVRRKQESGMTGRSEIRTMFDYIDADEGRSLAEPRGG